MYHPLQRKSYCNPWNSKNKKKKKVICLHPVSSYGPLDCESNALTTRLKDLIGIEGKKSYHVIILPSNCKQISKNEPLVSRKLRFWRDFGESQFLRLDVVRFGKKIATNYFWNICYNFFQWFFSGAFF